MQHKSIPQSDAKAKATTGADGAGYLAGYANTFGVKDSAGEIVLAGAFDETIKAFNKSKDGMPFMDNHQLFGGTSAVIGKVIELKADKYGLFFKAVFASSQGAQEVRTKFLEGFLDSFSIGYKIDKASMRQDGTRLLHKLTLREISAVIFPANAQSKVTNVKNLPIQRAKMLAEQYAQMGRDLEFLEMRIGQMKRLDRRLEMLEKLAAPQIAADALTPEQLGWIV